MNDQLQKVAEMIKKTFHTKQQKDCFDGCTLYVEERCAFMRTECMKNLEIKFEKISTTLEIISGCVKDIKKEVGLNGSATGKS